MRGSSFVTGIKGLTKQATQYSGLFALIPCKDTMFVSFKECSNKVLHSEMQNQKDGALSQTMNFLETGS